MAGRLPKITDYEAKKAQNKADALPTNIPQLNQAITPSSQSVREGFQQMGELNPQQPVLEKVNPNEVYASTRSQALGHELNFNDPQKAMEYWNASPYEFWTEQVKRDPNNTYSIVNQMFASNETPEQKRKRERREALGETFRGLGNLIGNVANLYYTHRGGQYIDLNSVNEKHRERMDRIKEKQDALAERQKEILMNARLGDIKAERAEKAADKKLAADKAAAQLKFKQDLYMKELDNTYKMGQIDAQTKAKLAQDVFKAKTNKELESIKAKYNKDLEAFKQQNRLELNDANGGSKKSTFTYGGTAYDKKSLSSMVALYNKLRQDGYAMPKVKGNNINQYIDAIANSMSKGTYNIGDFSKGAEAKYPNIIDSDLNQENRNGVLAWKGEDETNKTYWD